MDKQQFLSIPREAQAELEQRLGTLDEAQMTNRPAPEAWSIKDSLAHLTYWEQYMLNNVREALVHGKSPQWVTKEEEDALNAQIVEETQEQSLDNVLSVFRASHEEMLAEVEALPDDVLFDPNRFDWLQGTPMWQYIANESFGEHREEHLALLLE